MAVRRQGWLQFYSSADEPASDLQIFNQLFWLVAIKSFSISSCSKPVGQLKNIHSFFFSKHILHAAFCLCPAAYIGFCARLAGRWSAPASVILFCFSSWPDGTTPGTGLLPSTLLTLLSGGSGLDVKTSSPAQSPGRCRQCGATSQTL